MALYVGIDCSTQSISVVVLDAWQGDVVFRDSLPLAEPFLRYADPQVVHADPHVWTAGLTVVLERVARNVDRGRLRAIAGSAQQHGSVYCGDTPDVLTRSTSPIWMDASTGRECDEIEAALGGPAAVARLTGSRAFPRFTGPQIRKFAREQLDHYARTTRIHLVSSYLASLLVGSHAPVDHADASGMTLMDLRTKMWSAAALEATAPALLQKLPPLVPSQTAIGTLAPQWQARFGFPPLKVVAWSGDNPCSVVGTGLTIEGELTISLGTSDTIFGPMKAPRVSTDGTGHVFASPLGDYLGITVFSNGSLARDAVRQRFELTWDGFSAALRTTPAGNGGAMMLPWFEPEITPQVSMPRVHRFGLDGAAPAQEIRALVESQAMALSRHSEWMGVRPTVIHATGGAAANREILQVLADVFDADVQAFETTDAAALGAAMRAYQADVGVSWEAATRPFLRPLHERMRPIPANVLTYEALRPVYAARERAALINSA
jgi:xylulokinase